VRGALELQEGDELLFQVERSRAVIAKAPSFLELAGTVAVLAEKRGTTCENDGLHWPRRDGSFSDVLRRTRSQRAGPLR